MYNRNPQDVANERSDVPETYEENHERLATSEAELRRTTDPVSGADPETERVNDEDQDAPDR